IDANGILHVSAKDKATGKENKITIKANSGLTEAEIDKMVRDAESHAAEDHQRVELTNARNQADAMVHSVRKSLAEHGEKVDASEKAKIEDALKAVEESLKGDDKADIEAKTQALMAASQKLGEAMYAQQQPGGPDGAQPGADGAQAGGRASADDDVVDADFKEVKRD